MEKRLKEEPLLAPVLEIAGNHHLNFFGPIWVSPPGTVPSSKILIFSIPPSCFLRSVIIFQ